MGIREIKVEKTDYSQTFEDKLEVLRLKVNSIITLINTNIKNGILSE